MIRGGDIDYEFTDVLKKKRKRKLKLYDLTPE
jgi:hypothetical protein